MTTKSRFALFFRKGPLSAPEDRYAPWTPGSLSSFPSQDASEQPIVDVWIERSVDRHLLETRGLGIDQRVVFGGHHRTGDPKRKRRFGF